MLSKVRVLLRNLFRSTNIERCWGVQSGRLIAIGLMFVLPAAPDRTLLPFDEDRP
jgi:hypothetical protein